MLLRFKSSVLSSRISPALRRSFEIVATVVTAAAPWTIGAHEDKINDEIKQKQKRKINEKFSCSKNRNVGKSL